MYMYMAVGVCVWIYMYLTAGAHVWMRTQRSKISSRYLPQLFSILLFLVLVLLFGFLLLFFFFGKISMVPWIAFNLLYRQGILTTVLALNSQRSTYICLLNAGIKSLCATVLCYFFWDRNLHQTWSSLTWWGCPVCMSQLWDFMWAYMATSWYFTLILERENEVLILVSQKLSWLSYFSSVIFLSPKFTYLKKNQMNLLFHLYFPLL